MVVEKEILFEPSPKQSEFLSLVLSGKYRVILFGGAIRGGKTYAGLGTLLILCRLFPGSRWAVVRDTLPTLKRNTLPSFNKICPKSFLKSYNQDLQTVTFNNGSQIIFFAENYYDDKELNRWKGLEVNGFLLEEANELQEASFYKAVERSGSFIPAKGLKKPKPIIMMTCNPANNWIKRLVFDRWEANELPEDWAYIPSKITDNPFIMADADYVKSLENLPRFQYEVFVEGNWNIQLKTGGEFYKCFELDQHVTELKYKPKVPLHISFDDNVNPYLPCGIFQIYKVADHTGKVVGHQLHMIDEIAGITPKNTVKDVCAEFIRKYPHHEAGLFVYGDATANKEDTKMEKGMNFFRLIMDYLKQYKPTNRVALSNPSVVMRGNWINTVFEKEIGGLTFLIGKDCKNTVNDFVLLKEGRDGEKFKEMETHPTTKVRQQKVGHFSDLFDYIACSAFAAEYQAYQRGTGGLLVTTGKNRSKNSY